MNLIKKMNYLIQMIDKNNNEKMDTSSQNDLEIEFLENFNKIINLEENNLVELNVESEFYMNFD